MAGTARRAVLRGALLGVALALLPRAARAQPRVSKAAADYQDHPQGHFNCAICAQFRPPHACLIVEGRISPNGWCRFFDLGD
ncbi:MAG: hypothetical protein ACREFK_05085 [Stellaceae bacterium]